MCKTRVKIAVLFLIAFVFIACATYESALAENPLRVGITPDYPPIIFKQAGKISGVEADIARMLGKELQRPVQFIELRWEEQIPALLEKRIDIIMSGMSVTKAREVRISFSDHYLKSGLVAAMRAEDAKKYDSIEKVMQSYTAIGAVKDTTGDAYVKRNFPNAIRKTSLSKAGDGAIELKRRAIDIFIHDAPSIIWIVSENEADITALWEPFNEEYLAWGIRKDDEKFFMQVNNILKKWKQDGTLKQILNKWLPAQYMKGFN